MNRKILVVDDEEDVRELLVNVLDDAGYEFEELSDGNNIVENVLRIGPALVLLDLTMPVVDGFQALEMLKADARTKDLPVIVASAQARNEVMLKVRDLGASDFLIKPWEDGEVEWRIEQVLGPLKDESAA